MATQMKAPPSTKKEIVDVPFNYRHLVDKYSPGGRYIDAQSDDDSPWVPFGPTAAIKHLSFDVRRNLFSNILWVKGPGTIGTHFHRGTITRVVLEGSVRYLEYDWVATPGGLILEVPGESHTLVTEHPDPMKVFFVVSGPLMWLDEQGNTVGHYDVFDYLRDARAHYEECGVGAAYLDTLIR